MHHVQFFFLHSVRTRVSVQSTWSGLRNEFAGIDPAQMNRLLQNYKLPEGTTRPAEWEPTPDDARQARSESKILLLHSPTRLSVAV